MMIDSSCVTVLFSIVLISVQGVLFVQSGYVVPCYSGAVGDAMVLSLYCEKEEMTTVWYDATSQTEDRSLYFICDMKNGDTMGNMIEYGISLSGEKTINRPVGSLSCQITACYTDALYDTKLSFSNVCFFDDEEEMTVNDTSAIIDPSSTYLDFLPTITSSLVISPTTSLSPYIPHPSTDYISTFQSSSNFLSYSTSLSSPISFNLASTAPDNSPTPSNDPPVAVTVQFIFQLSVNVSCKDWHKKTDSLSAQLIKLISLNAVTDDINLQNTSTKCIALLHQYQLQLHVLTDSLTSNIRATLLDLIQRREFTGVICGESVEYMCVLLGRELLSCFEMDGTQPSTTNIPPNATTHIPSTNNIPSTQSTTGTSILSTTTVALPMVAHNQSSFLHLPTSSSVMASLYSAVTTSNTILYLSSSSSSQLITLTSLIVIITVGGGLAVILIALILIVVVFHKRNITKQKKQYDLEMKSIH